MFDVDDFIADCVTARSETNTVLAIKEVLDRALSKSGEIASALPATTAELTVLYSADDLTILKVVWAPSMSIAPHNHLMWAVNGIYEGQEDNTFFRRQADRLVESGGRQLAVAESAILGRDVIHAVTNPHRRACTGSIHIYGGDFVRQQRSIWDPDTFEERPSDGETTQRIFEAARIQHQSAGG